MDNWADQLEEMRKQVDAELQQTGLAMQRQPQLPEGLPDMSALYELGTQALQGPTLEQKIQQQVGVPPPVEQPPVDLGPQTPVDLGVESNMPNAQAPLDYGQGVDELIAGFSNVATGLRDNALAWLSAPQEAFRQTHDSLIIGNSVNVGTFIRDMGTKSNNPYVQGIGNTLIKIGKNTQPWNRNKQLHFDDLFDIGRPPGTTAHYVAQALGSTLGSMGPMLGAAAAVSALPVAAPTATGLSVAAAFGTSFMQNYGDVRNSLDRTLADNNYPLDEQSRINGSMLATLPIAGLDVLGIEFLGALGVATLRKSLRDKVVDAIASNVGRGGKALAGAFGEGTTEFAQQMMQEAYLAIYEQHPDWAQKFVNSMDSFFGGALLGGGVSYITAMLPEAGDASPTPRIPPKVPPPGGAGKGTDSTIPPAGPAPGTAPSTPEGDASTAPEPVTPPVEVPPEEEPGLDVEPEEPGFDTTLEPPPEELPSVEPTTVEPAPVEPTPEPEPEPEPTPAVGFSRGDRYVVVDATIDPKTVQQQHVRLLTGAELEQLLGTEPSLQKSAVVYKVDSGKILPGRLGGSFVSYAYALPFLKQQRPDLQLALDGVLKTLDPSSAARFAEAAQQIWDENHKVQMRGIRTLQELDDTVANAQSEQAIPELQLPAIAGTLTYKGALGELAPLLEKVNPLDVNITPAPSHQLSPKGILGTDTPDKIRGPVRPRISLATARSTPVTAASIFSDEQLKQVLREYARKVMMRLPTQSVAPFVEAMYKLKNPTVSKRDIQSLLNKLEQINAPFTYAEVLNVDSYNPIPIPTSWLGEGFSTVDDSGRLFNQLVTTGAYTDKQGLVDWPFIEETGFKATGQVYIQKSLPAEMQTFVSILNKLMQRFLPKDKLVFVAKHEEDSYGSYSGPYMSFRGNMVPTGWHVINLSPKYDTRKQLTTLFHEFGHAISFRWFSKLPSSLMQQAYNAWRISAAGNVNYEFGEPRLAFGTRNRTEAHLIDWYGFHEWFSTQLELKLPEQQFVELFKEFPELQKELTDYIDTVKDLPGFKSDPVFDEILSHFEVPPGIVANAVRAAEINEAIQNAKYLPGVDNTVPFAPFITKAMAANHPQMSALASYFNWSYKWLWNILQLADANKHILPLQRYVEHMDAWNRTRMHWMNRAAQRKREWEGLGRKQVQAVSDLLFAVQKMQYVPAGQPKRYPTVSELAALAQQHGVNAEGLQVYHAVVKDFHDLLMGVRDTLLLDAAKQFAGQPALLTQKYQEIMRDFQVMASKPYFPYTRFGRYHVVLTDSSGTTYREGFESEKQMRLALKRIAAMALPHEKIAIRTIPEEFVPFMGLPPQLLDKIATQMHLTPAQQQELKELTYELSPAHSFNKHFIRRDSIGGYSTDGLRVYADYFFHAANHIARIKYGPEMEVDIKSMEPLIQAGLTQGEIVDVRKMDRIKQYMEWHKNDTMNPQREWHLLRGIAFVWNFFAEPLSAAVNMLQTPTVTAPYLARRFGDLSTNRELARAAVHFRGLYNNTTSGLSVKEHEVIQEAIDQGIIDQSFAEDLAGLANGSVLQRLYGGEAIDRYFRTGLRWGAFLFHHAERVQRFVGMLSAYRLATQQGTAKFGANFNALHSDLISSLVARGWTQREAEAFAAAKETVRQTHFEYARWAKSRLLRGKKSSLFVFMNYLNNMLWIVGKKPERWRTLAVILASAGVMGLPGADDLSEILKALGYLIGKNFNPEAEAYKLLHHVMDKPDLVLHGMGRYGLGMEFLGEVTGLPIPTGDVSGRLSMGKIIPGLSALTGIVGPYGADSASGLVGDIGTQASGAAFGMVGSWLNALAHSSDPNAGRYVEMAMPRVLRSLMTAYRYIQEGQATSLNGEPLVKWDLNDPSDLAQIAGTALGAPATKVRQAQEQRRWVKEQMAWMEGRRAGLVEQLWQSIKTKNAESRADAIAAIQEYNREIGSKFPLLTIKKDDLKQSISSRAKGQALVNATGESNKRDIGTRAALERQYGLGKQ